jgi:hypothetical protein
VGRERRWISANDKSSLVLINDRNLLGLTQHGLVREWNESGELKYYGTYINGVVDENKEFL